jgi:hypothetical protein
MVPAYRPENHVKLQYRCEACHCMAVETLDAKTVSEVLGLTLSGMDKSPVVPIGAALPISMTGGGRAISPVKADARTS